MRAYPDVTAAAAALQIAPPHPFIEDGTLHRYGKRSEHWYVSYGEAGAIGTFKHGFRKATWCRHSEAMSARQAARLKADIARAKAKRAAEQKARHAHGAANAVATWNNLTTHGISDYLTRKQVGAFGVRFGDGYIAIPLRQSVGGAIHSLQLIYDDHATPDYMRKQGRNKTFIKDGRKHGCFHMVGSKALLNAPYIMICEGYATGASLHMATGAPVAVAFDCGNLKPVLRELVKHYPQKRIIIAADNDCYSQAQPSMGCA